MTVVTPRAPPTRTRLHFWAGGATASRANDRVFYVVVRMFSKRRLQFSALCRRPIYPSVKKCSTADNQGRYRTNFVVVRSSGDFLLVAYTYLRAKVRRSFD